MEQISQDIAVWRAARQYLIDGWPVYPLAEASSRLTGSGFVNAPPSRHPEGGCYQRINPHAPIAALPADLVNRIHALDHRPRWKLLRRYLFQKYIRPIFNALTRI